MKSGKDTYVSNDLLDQGEGINGFSNVAAINKEYSSTIRRVNQSNLVFHEKKGEFELVQYSETTNPTVIIEEDMFGKEKVWLKESNTTNHFLEKIENESIIDKKLRDKILDQAIISYVEDQKLKIYLSINLSEEQKPLIDKNEKKIVKLIKDFIESNKVDFHTDNGICHLYVNNSMKETLFNYVNDGLSKTLSTQSFLLKKADTDIDKQKKKTNIKNKI